MNKKQKNKKDKHGFTIVELLVVISIIALLVGILVPAVNKARDTAKTTQSKSNLHQVSLALANYAADWNGDNFTAAPPNLAGGNRTFTSIASAIAQLSGDAGDDGWTPMGIRLGEIAVGNGNAIAFLNNTDGIAPYVFTSGNTSGAHPGLGTWRYPNALQCAEYMHGLPLHKAYFSPKDIVPLRALEQCDEANSSYCVSTLGQTWWGLTALWTSNMILAPSSYCLSPGLMYNAAVYDPLTPVDPMDIPTGFRPSSTDQARFPNLKTWLMEHYWLQNVRTSSECGLYWDGTWFNEGVGTWDGCEPFHFNGSYNSTPVTVFVDGHVGVVDVAQASRDDMMIAAASDDGIGLWNQNTTDEAFGYYTNGGADWIVWSGHTHTNDGVRGRDLISK